MLNNVCLNGRLTKECELEQVGKSDSVKTRFTLAVNRDYKDKDGVTPCDFIDCEIWNAGANFLEQYANKGDMLSVSGSLRKDTWKDSEGEWQSRTYVSCAAVNIVARAGKKDEDEDEDEDEKPKKKKPGNGSKYKRG